MKTLSILHITDLHFGKKTSPYGNTIDEKDKETACCVEGIFKGEWINAFENKLIQWQREKELNIDLIAFTGDLCYGGDKLHMEEGIQFLIRICNKLKLSLDKIIISPGNHDLDRNSPGKEFEILAELCNKYGIINFACYDKIINIKIKEIPVISINSCMGATAKVNNIQVDYFKSHILKLKDDPDFKGKIIEACSNANLYFQTELDIPAIGDFQLDNALEAISGSNDASIILMHHNPIPNANIEIRPYSNMLDNGVVLYKLLDTGRKIFILHGHTHFPSSITSFLPQFDDRNNFLCTIGCGCLNDTENSKAEIVECMFTNDNIHFKTIVHEVARNSSSCFMTNNSYEIRNRDGELNIDIDWSLLARNRKHSFPEIKGILNEDFAKKNKGTLNDEEILMGLLNLSKSFKIARNQSSDPNNWHFTRTH
jgi:predicted MPP superfamily phosphohydrolase